MKNKRIFTIILAAALIFSSFSFGVSAANDGDANIDISVGSDYKPKGGERKKTNSTSCYFNYKTRVNGTAATGPASFIGSVFAALPNHNASAFLKYEDCTTFYYVGNTMYKRKDAVIKKNTKGYIRQDVNERRYTYATIAGKKVSSTGTAKGKWSPDSNPESGCIDYNNGFK